MISIKLKPFDRTNLTSLLSSLYIFLKALLFLPFVFIFKRFQSLNETFVHRNRIVDPSCTNTKPKLPPGIAPWPIIRNIPEMLRNKPTFRWIHTLMKLFKTDIFCLRLGKTHVITVTCPKIAREILKQQDTVFASRPITYAQQLITSNNLTTALSPFGDQWKKMKRVLVNEIISPARHRLLHDKRSEEADNLLTYVHNLSKASKNVDLRIVTRYYCGNVIRRLMFNKRHFGKTTEDGGPGVEEIEHVEAFLTTLGYLYSFCVSDFLPGLVGLDIEGHEKILKEANDIVDKYHDPIINERIKLWRVDGEYNRERAVDDFLDALISLNDKNGKPLLTREEIRAQSREIMLAAVDNPSNAVEWVIAEMLNQPEILQKATEEIDMIVGKNRLVQESDIPKLNYVKSCIREAFRLHPIAPFNVPHESLTDTTVAGYFIPKGSWIMLSRIGLGRNPNVWVEPLKFRPERHLTECSTVALTEHDLRFVSFSTGRRGCIAATLGTCMTTMLLARLLQGFRWSLPEDTTSVDLSESIHDLFMAKPLTARAEARLPSHLYPEVY